MAHMRRKLVLVGPLAGKTKVLRGVRFTNGEAILEGPDSDVLNLSKYLRRSYQAIPAEELNNGGIPHHEDGSEDGTGGVQEDGAGAQEAANGDEPDADTDPEGQRSEEQAETPDGPVGNEVNEKLRRAVLQLDPSNDEHWTQAGKPSISAITQLYGAGDVTRADIEAAAPGLLRDSAR